MLYNKEPIFVANLNEKKSSETHTHFVIDYHITAVFKHSLFIALSFSLYSDEKEQKMHKY